MLLAQGVSEKPAQGVCVCLNSLGTAAGTVWGRTKARGGKPCGRLWKCPHLQTGKSCEQRVHRHNLREMCASVKSLGQEPDQNWNHAQSMLEEGGLSQISRNKKDRNRPGVRRTEKEAQFPRNRRDQHYQAPVAPG